ncbi:phycobilisome rod-core linker polypeptide [Chamaesiphon minutus]|uniref:Phycobilisome Linker polypeptide/CpcD/allophycocyanin linker domain protein n=1 Tax=Chamaesiphon minutus (strain ATCC 27169 / PCC 6605) TaxID=1173020 RepID=K9UKP3_CHAP6|nr:phycobilisome rod-core linker polypeptide [Chamaesiphon minutus]AFY95021.1 Phycobilisome Linker polypeptide/CpcD/allophycocyanin linker domain protein [Chamaesiphon minutus PCC 6605]
MALWVSNADATELWNNSSEDDLQTAIRAAYRQVLGNAHVMESQRLTSAESMLRNGDINMRGFIRAIAQSDLYRALFFETSSAYRFIELNCKHFLGRAPLNQAEISDHVRLYNERGYEAEINSYIDSDEYGSKFGENIVPSAQGNRTQVGIENVNFNRTFALDRGFAAYDAASKNAKLIGDIAGNRATKIGFPAGGAAYANTSKRFRIAVNKAKFGARVTQSNASFEVSYSQLSKQIQNIQKTGAKILSISEVS